MAPYHLLWWDWCQDTVFGIRYCCCCQRQLRIDENVAFSLLFLETCLTTRAYVCSFDCTNCAGQWLSNFWCYCCYQRQLRINENCAFSLLFLETRLTTGAYTCSFDCTHCVGQWQRDGLRFYIHCGCQMLWPLCADLSKTADWDPLARA